jgi:hypothetical protein
MKHFRAPATGPAQFSACQRGPAAEQIDPDTKQVSFAADHCESHSGGVNMRDIDMRVGWERALEAVLPLAGSLLAFILIMAVR